MTNDLTPAPIDWRGLSAPIAPTDIVWRQDGKAKDYDGVAKARFVPYIEAGTVRRRLDDVALGRWSLQQHVQLPPIAQSDDNGVERLVYLCHASLSVGDDCVRACYGEGSTAKEAATDAFKRAAQRFGIGHELYDMSAVMVRVDSATSKYPKPLEDPAEVYARKQSHGADETEPLTGNAAPRYPTTPAKSSNTAPDACPQCGGAMWDNRATKKGKQPDYKCKTKTCDGAVWLKDGASSKSTAEPEEITRDTPITWSSKLKGQSVATLTDAQLAHAMEDLEKRVPKEWHEVFEEEEADRLSQADALPF